MVGSVHGCPPSFWYNSNSRQGVQTKEVALWTEAVSSSLVRQVKKGYGGYGIPIDECSPYSVFSTTQGAYYVTCCVCG